MKKFWVVIVLIAVGAALFFTFKSKNSLPENFPAGHPAVSENNSSAPGVTKNPESDPAGLTAVDHRISTNDATIPAASQNPAVMPVSSLAPLTVLDKARVAMKNYNSMFGENPVGTNAEITEALLGKNPKGVDFVTADSGLRVNANGEMVDAYGTPFFFHQLSGQEMEIRSAGEDRKMWTPDDLVTR